MSYNFDKKTQVGKWSVDIDSERQYGFFEHDDYGEGGGLWFVDNMLVDYDGVYELPDNVIKGIEDLGFNADYAKDDEDES
jgi:hypothetical protein